MYTEPSLHVLGRAAVITRSLAMTAQLVYLWLHLLFRGHGSIGHQLQQVRVPSRSFRDCLRGHARAKVNHRTVGRGVSQATETPV